MPRRPLGKRPGRPFRRPARGPLGRRGIPGLRPPRAGGGAVPPLLVAANQLAKSGNYEEAGKAYKKLAEKGTEHGHHKAPLLYFQAARCYFMLGNLTEALKILRTAAVYFAKEERWADLYRGLNQSVIFLNDKGYAVEAHTVESWAVEFIPKAVLHNLELSQKEHQAKNVSVQLPVHCPTCGGAVIPTEAEWVDETSVLCEFCGSVVRGE